MPYKQKNKAHTFYPVITKWGENNIKISLRGLRPLPSNLIKDECKIYKKDSGYIEINIACCVSIAMTMHFFFRYIGTREGEFEIIYGQMMGVGAAKHGGIGRKNSAQNLKLIINDGDSAFQFGTNIA